MMHSLQSIGKDVALPGHRLAKTTKFYENHPHILTKTNPHWSLKQPSFYRIIISRHKIHSFNSSDISLYKQTFPWKSKGFFFFSFPFSFMGYTILVFIRDQIEYYEKEKTGKKAADRHNLQIQAP